DVWRYPVTTQLKSPPLPRALVALTKAFAEDGISALDPDVPIEVWRAALAGPAAEFLSRPGKALREMIVTAGWTLGGGVGACPSELPLALELLHAGSLVIDDVEDGSTERRGRPALHCLVGTPLAINTGSWMYFWALAELAAVDAELVAVAARALVRCHQGQALDLAVRITDIESQYVPKIVETCTRLKTGQLCRLAAELGARAADADPETLAAIGNFAERMGIGLQMLDDLGCLVGDRCAKGGEDLRNARPTWPWAWLAELGLVIAPDPELMYAAVAAHGRARIRATLDAALAHLAPLAPHPMIDRIARELSNMENSYG
ncbi:MAG TPA: polyprenyl synthetase family protein, partial [Kofleriaceae bacterium]